MSANEEKARANYEELRDCVTAQDMSFEKCFVDALNEMVSAARRHNVRNLERLLDDALERSKEDFSFRMHCAQMKKQRLRGAA